MNAINLYDIKNSIIGGKLADCSDEQLKNIKIIVSDDEELNGVHALYHRDAIIFNSNKEIKGYLDECGINYNPHELNNKCKYLLLM